MANLIKCDNINCFANKCGARCDILVEKPSQPCSFFKTDEQVDKERMEAHKHLLDINRPDLIRKYEYNKERKW